MPPFPFARADPPQGRGGVVPAELLRLPRPALKGSLRCRASRALFSLNFPAVDFLIPARTCSRGTVSFLFLLLFLCLDTCSETWPAPDDTIHHITTCGYPQTTRTSYLAVSST